MEKGATCEHLNKLSNVLGKDLWQTKETLSCFDCGCPGPNLWICLQPDCHHIGCSEGKNDHSTIHQKSNLLHCVHMNISTERIWCYVCEKEVHMGAAIAHSRMSPDSTSIGSSSTSFRLGFDNSTGFNVMLCDEDPEDEEEMDYSEDPEARPKGLIGLQNMGNTCYMNAALQALSNTLPLTNYFLECGGAISVLSADKKPGLSRAYQKLIKDMWSRRSSGYVVPNAILYGIRTVHPMFRGYHQHDTQEFLRCFMDQLHEELKEPVWDTSTEDKLNSDADGDHREPRNIHMRRRAASSGASDAPLFARMRRKSPASAMITDAKADGYIRTHTQSEGASATRHRRSASFAGTNYSAYNMQATAHYSPSEAAAKDVGSESELSSEAEDRYETCSSCASDSPDPPSSGDGACGDGSGVRYRSVVSDVFDGKLLSSVQCLICNRVSTRVETFQDLSLPIPSREHLAVIRAQQSLLSHAQPHNSQDSWMWWVLGWLKSWFYGPVVSLQDCLAAFFSADELKGDNMYSCSRCNKLRNGVKMSGVMRLPEVLCVHLKRFRHELMFSSKVGARVAFPLHDLNMAPYLHKECTSKVSRYSLCAVISHSGTAGGGHYTCVARNARARAWYEYDDQSVVPLPPAAVAHLEAYVLFYRKVNPHMAVLRQKAAEILESTSVEPNDIQFYISKQWINKFNTWAEPGPIDNSDVVCAHGSVRPDRAPHIRALAARVPQPLWDFLYHNFGGGPACSHVHECGTCARAAQLLSERRARELAAFYHLHASFQEQPSPHAIYAISMQWFRQWQNFVRGHSPRPPPPIDNSPVLTKQEVDGKTTYSVKAGSDHAQLSEELWLYFRNAYGGGPELRVRSPARRAPPVRRCDSDHEHVPDTEPDTSHNRPTTRQAARASEDERVSHNSDEEQNPPKPCLENGFVDHEPTEPERDTDLPDMDSISLKAKAPKTGKVRKMRKRTAK